jgi:hypothetical protein
MPPNSQVKQQQQQQQQDVIPSRSSSPYLSISPTLSPSNLLAPKRCISFENNENETPIKSPETPTPTKLAPPRFTLHMRPNPFHFPQDEKHDEKFSNDEPAHQRQLLLRRASVNAYNSDDSVILTPRWHLPSCDFLSPPSIPKHDRQDDCIVVRYIPTELMLPWLA